MGRGGRSAQGYLSTTILTSERWGEGGGGTVVSVHNNPNIRKGGGRGGEWYLSTTILTSEKGGGG